MNVYVYPADLYGCGHYRLLYPAMAVQRLFPDITVNIITPGADTYLAAVVQPNGDVTEVVTPPDADVILMQRPSFPQLARAIPLFRKKGIAVVVDIDDDLAHIDPRNPAWLAMHPKADFKKQQYAALYLEQGEPEKAKAIMDGRAKIAPHSWKEVERACREATMVTVSTPALADVYGRGHSAVLRNYVPEDFLRVPRVDSDVIGWAGSTHSHPGDLAAMGTSIRRLEADGAQFMIVGSSDGADRELNLGHPVPCTGAIDYDKWISAVAQIGVGVAPLADTRFNRGKCLDASSMVMTDRGVMALSAITTTDHVWHAGDWRKVIATEHDRPRAGLFITTKRGHTIKITPEHRLLTEDGWKHGEDLAPGAVLVMEPEEWFTADYVRVPWPADSRKTRHTDKFDHRSFWTHTRGPCVVIDEVWGRFLGLLLGDGTIAASGGVSICGYEHDDDLRELVANDMRSFGLNVTVRSQRTRAGDRGPIPAVWDVTTTSASLVRVLECMGIARVHDRGRGYTKNFDIPEVIWRSPRSVAFAFLSGLFEADASMHSSISLSTKSETLARSVQRLLTALGIISHVRTYSKKLSYTRTNGSTTYQSWTVTILSREADKFLAEGSPLSERKKVAMADRRIRRAAPGQHGHGHVEHWNDTIVSVTPTNVTPIDVQVEGEVLSVHGIVSHNSWLKPLEYSAAGVPWVASPRAEYRALQELGAGVLADREKEWTRALRELVTNEAYRREQSEASRVLASMLTIEQHAWRWAEIWQQALMRQRGTVGAA